VSLGAWGINRRNDPRVQAGTFMHELGHTLGLRHGGGDDILYKPNYYSVMNYTWQTPKSVTAQDTLSWALVYSPSQLPSLNENQIYEPIGLGLIQNIYPVVKIPYQRPNGTYSQALLKSYTAVDFDGDGDSTGYTTVPVDLNHLVPNDPTSLGQMLDGYADWPNLQYNFRNSPGVFSKTTSEVLVNDEMTEEIYNQLQTLPPYGIVSPLIYWSSDPNENIPISTGTLTQNNPIIVSDGEGGAYIAFNNGTGISSTAGIYAQKLDAFGAIQWINNGTPIATGPEISSISDFISDGNGNAIVSWVSRRTGFFDIFAQKINRFGQAIWQSNGILVTTAPTLPVGPNLVKMKSDGEGGAILVWADTHLGVVSFFAQRVDASGNVLWNPGGVLINNSLYNSGQFEIASDGLGGVIITWTDKRNGGVGDIYSQRVNSSGFTQWTTNGVPICDASGHQDAAVLVNDGFGGAIVAWINYRSGGNDIYGQHVDSLGQSLWVTNGVSVVSIAGGKSYLNIVSDGSHGAILSWLDGRRTPYRDSYVQRIDSAGITLWTTNGITISDTNLICYESKIIDDGNKGAIVVLARQNVFQDNKLNIFAQLIDSTGSILWAINGAPITLANTPQPFQNLSAVSNQTGGAIIAWGDGRTDTGGSGIRHIYAQNVTSNGVLGGGVSTGIDEYTMEKIPSEMNLWQNYPNPFNPSTTIRYGFTKQMIVSLKIFNILGQEVATLVNEEKPACNYEVNWNATNFSSGVYFYRLQTGSYVEVKKMLLLK
jgi:hypothetical protein